MKDIIFYTNKNFDETKIKNVGNYLSDDRFYTFVNKTIDEELNKANKLTRLIINYLYSSSNYKHDSNLSKKFNWFSFFIDLFCILSTIAFFVCLATGILTPLIQFLTNKNQNGFHLDTQHWILLGFAIFFMIIAILYLILVFKYKKINKSLSLQVYVQKKLNSILFLKDFFKLTKFTKKALKIQQKKEQIIYLLDNAQTSSMPTIWLSLQIMNTISLIFDDEISIAIALRNLNENDIDSFLKIAEHDFCKVKTIVKDVINETKESILSYSAAAAYNLPAEKASGWLNTILVVIFGGALGGIIGGIR